MLNNAVKVLVKLVQSAHQCILRWTDNCPNQYKCKYTNQKLLDAPQSLGVGGHVEWNYFEPGEGKNSSDSLGALAKLAYFRAVSKHPDMVARSAAAVVTLISEELSKSTEKLSFLKVLNSVLYNTDHGPGDGSGLLLPA